MTTRGEYEYKLRDITKCKSGSRITVVVMIGPPASGKSRLASSPLGNTRYIHINQATCKNREKCLTSLTTELAMAAKSDKPYAVIIDSTNPTRERRMEYVDIVTRCEEEYEIKITVKYVVMSDSRELYEHLNMYRTRMYFHDNNDKKKSIYISPIAYNNYYKNYEPPEDDRGVDEIIYFHCVPKFSDKYSVLMFMQKS